MRTRTKKMEQIPCTAKDEANNVHKHELGPTLKQPPQTLILPKEISAKARIVSFPNPATAISARYLLCPEQGCFEFTRITAPSSQPRSWLVAPCKKEADATGFVLEKPDLLIATQIDPIFLLIPNMIDAAGKVDTEYLTSSDHVAKLAQTSAHMRQILEPRKDTGLEGQLKSRVISVCDAIDMGDESLYALSIPKLVKVLVEKAKRMSSKGLPSSMEDRFVKETLNVPVLSIKREESNISIVSTESGAQTGSQVQGEESTQDSNTDPQSTVGLSSGESTVTTGADDSVASLLRLRIAFEFLLGSYIPQQLQAELKNRLTDQKISGIGWAVLNNHLEHVNRLKKEAHALRTLSDNISRKRSGGDDDEANERAEAKKRKKEEEDLRKKNTSQGVKKLLKADTSGMKKLSSFFTKK